MPWATTNSRSLVVSVGVQCHVGKERSENQDRVTRAATPFGDLFVVADGVGGYQGGSEAAEATVAGFAGLLNAPGNLSLPDSLRRAEREINLDLQRRAAANPALRGMGSTAVLCVVNRDRVTYAHVGDSRLYLMRDHQLRQLTRDHSVIERLISQGVLTPDRARQHPDANVLTRAIGQPSEAGLDIAEITLRQNDALLLCSDGLWGYAPHREMETIAGAEQLSASAVATGLLNLALEGGGGDNISIQFLRFKSRETPRQPWRLLGMESKIAVPLALAAILGIATILLSVPNYRNRIGEHSDQSRSSQREPTMAPSRESKRPPHSPEHRTIAPTPKAEEKVSAKPAENTVDTAAPSNPQPPPSPPENSEAPPAQADAPTIPERIGNKVQTGVKAGMDKASSLGAAAKKGVTQKVDEVKKQKGEDQIPPDPPQN
jgi:serine/threonine protein phosphatase PrpC